MYIHVHDFMNMYMHVCIMFRHVSTVFHYPVQVGRIPDGSPDATMRMRDGKHAPTSRLCLGYIYCVHLESKCSPDLLS